MKNIKIYIIIAASFFLCSIAKSQTATTQDSLLFMNLVNFIGKPVDSLLTYVPQSYDTLFTASAGNLLEGPTVHLAYSQIGYAVCIGVGTNNYTTRFNSQRLPFAQAWPLNLSTKELIQYIEIRKNWIDVVRMVE